jgi:hypothetical protein
MNDEQVRIWKESQPDLRFEVLMVVKIQVEVF